MRFYTSYPVLMIAMMMVISCQEDRYLDSGTSSDNAISVDVTSLNFISTKGVPINSASDSLFKTLGVLGYHTNVPFANAPSPESSYLPNLEVKKAADGSWQFDKLYYWPLNGTLSFFAYSPYGGSDNGITVESVQGKNPTLSYKMPQTVDQQPDLMVAVPQLNKQEIIVPLQFHHALACIGFEVSGDSVPIDSIGVRGVYTSGTLMLDMNNGTPQWTSLSDYSDNFYRVGLVSDAQATNPVDTIMAYNGYLMMIPQTLSDDAAIIVKFKGMDPKVISLKTAGTTEWTAGNKYMYLLREGVYTLTVVSDQYSVGYLGGDFDLKISSIYTKADGTVEDMDWTAKVIDPSTGNVTWLDSLSTLVDQNGGVNISKTLQAALSPFTSSSGIDQYIKSRPFIDKASMVDLSYVKGYYSSANCYSVNAPGWYKFPCWAVGNGIMSATSSGYDLNSLKDDCYPKTASFFVDYKNNPITDNSGLLISTTDASASLVWMDAPDLVTEVALSEDSNYITFLVDSATIRQGNSVIAIKDKSGTIMWSWHIWVNEWTLPIIDYTSYAEFFGNNIGVCYPATYDYPQRSVTLRFTQALSNLTVDVTLTQTPEHLDMYLNAPYYQWGRKDPMLPSDGFGNNKPCFGPDVFRTESGSVGVDVAIQNPNIFYTSAKDWNLNVNNYLWGDTTLSSVKTIYDPSPTAFQIPSKEIMNELEPVGWFPDYPGYEFKFGDSSTVLFMVFGYRDGNGATLTESKTKGYYWTNGYNQENSYYIFGFTQSSLGYVPYGSAFGASIMPVQNKKYP